ncbi:hypothetical protein LCGC14_2285770, partial [marine sediment metagenome]
EVKGKVRRGTKKWWQIIRGTEKERGCLAALRQGCAATKLESNEKLRASLKRWWADPQNKERIAIRNRNVRLGIIKAVNQGKCQPSRPSTLEKQVEAILNIHFPNEWLYTGDGRITIEGYKPDFTNVNGKKLIIEAAGRHWHDPDYASRRAETFAKFGYKTLVIWDTDDNGKRLKKLPEETIVKMVSQFSE